MDSPEDTQPEETKPGDDGAQLADQVLIQLKGPDGEVKDERNQ